MDPRFAPMVGPGAAPGFDIHRNDQPQTREEAEQRAAVLQAELQHLHLQWDTGGADEGGLSARTASSPDAELAAVSVTTPRLPSPTADFHTGNRTPRGRGRPQIPALNMFRGANVEAGCPQPPSPAAMRVAASSPPPAQYQQRALHQQQYVQFQAQQMHASQGTYPQQTGYSPQGAYPQQTGYASPQQTGYSQQGAYPQQTGYSPQGAQQTGYSPQGAYPQQTGYSPQGTFSPQTGYTQGPFPLQQGPYTQISSPNAYAVQQGTFGMVNCPAPFTGPATLPLTSPRPPVLGGTILPLPSNTGIPMPAYEHYVSPRVQERMQQHTDHGVSPRSYNPSPRPLPSPRNQRTPRNNPSPRGVPSPHGVARRGASSPSPTPGGPPMQSPRHTTRNLEYRPVQHQPPQALQDSPTQPVTIVENPDGTGGFVRGNLSGAPHQQQVPRLPIASRPAVPKLNIPLAGFAALRVAPAAALEDTASASSARSEMSTERSSIPTDTERSAATEDGLSARALQSPSTPGPAPEMLPEVDEEDDEEDEDDAVPATADVRSVTVPVLPAAGRVLVAPPAAPPDAGARIAMATTGVPAATAAPQATRAIVPPLAVKVPPLAVKVPPMHQPARPPALIAALEKMRQEFEGKRLGIIELLKKADLGSPLVDKALADYIFSIQGHQEDPRSTAHNPVFVNGRVKSAARFLEWLENDVRFRLKGEEA